MIEILKILAESLVKLISPEAIIKLRKEKKLNDLGVEVFLLYSTLNSILVQGRDILFVFEKALPWMKEKMEAGQPDSAYWQNLSFSLKQQLLTLNKFVAAYARLQTVLEVIQPEIKINLYPIIGGKINALRLLEHAITPWDGGPTRLVSINEEKLKNVVSIQRSTGDPMWQALFRSSRSPQGKGKDVFEGIIVEEGIKDMENLRADLYPTIEHYMQSGVQKAKLDEIEGYAKMLKESLDKHFSIQDILLSVGDARFE